MAFNYFNNKSLVGKKPNNQSGINNLNSNPFGGVVTYVNSSIFGAASFTANDPLATSSAVISGQGQDNIDYFITIEYTASSANILKWNITVSSESCCDPGYIILNGTSLVSIANGASNGTAFMRDGSNTLIVGYRKDSSVSDGSDNAIVNWTFTQ
jgi:hypothetical protein